MNILHWLHWILSRLIPASLRWELFDAGFDAGFDEGYYWANRAVYGRLAHSWVDWPQILELMAGDADSRADAAACIITGRYVHELGCAHEEAAQFIPSVA